MKSGRPHKLDTSKLGKLVKLIEDKVGVSQKQVVAKFSLFQSCVSQILSKKSVKS